MSIIEYKQLFKLMKYTMEINKFHFQNDEVPFLKNLYRAIQKQVFKVHLAYPLLLNQWLDQFPKIQLTPNVTHIFNNDPWISKL